MGVDRVSYNGINRGDIVKSPTGEECEVVDFGDWDGTHITLKGKDGEEFKAISYDCEVLVKAKPWDNEDRRRRYGLRVGDTVKCSYSSKGECEVVSYGGGDNNSIILEDKDGKEFKEVAEWCTIITKVEDK